MEREPSPDGTESDDEPFLEAGASAFEAESIPSGKSIHFDLPSYFDFDFLASAHSLCYAKKELDPI